VGDGGDAGLPDLVDFLEDREVCGEGRGGELVPGDWILTTILARLEKKEGMKGKRGPSDAP
jgi:hypothetical protein